jgi:uncharacterized protein (TIGR00251 family)
VAASTIRLRLRVSPGSRRPAVAGRQGDSWKVRVSAPPERGRANDAVVTLLAETLGISKSDVELVSGTSSRDKVVLVHGLSEGDAEARLTEAAGAAR